MFFGAGAARLSKVTRLNPAHAPPRFGGINDAFSDLTVSLNPKWFGTLKMSVDAVSGQIMLIVSPQNNWAFLAYGLCVLLAIATISFALMSLIGCLAVAFCLLAVYSYLL